MSQKPLFMLTPDTPLRPLIVCASGWEAQLRVVLCLYCPALQPPSHFLIQCCFEMLTLNKRKKNVKKKYTHKETHMICICIYTCPYKYT